MVGCTTILMTKLALIWLMAYTMMCCDLTYGITTKMNLHRYKAKIPASYTDSMFFDSVTWMIFGCFVVLAFTQVAINSEPFQTPAYTAGLEAMFEKNNIKGKILLVYFLAPFGLFLLKLLSLHSKFISGLFVLSPLLIGYFSLISAIYLYVRVSWLNPALCSATLYYGVLGILAIRDYQAYQRR